MPLIIATAKKEEIDKIRGLGLGADDYIVKPFSPSELVARVTAHINRYERLVSKSGEGTARQKRYYRNGRSQNRKTGPARICGWEGDYAFE